MALTDNNDFNMFGDNSSPQPFYTSLEFPNSNFDKVANPTEPEKNTILGMDPLHFSSMAAMLAQALSPKSYHPKTGQLMPSGIDMFANSAQQIAQGQLKAKALQAPQLQGLNPYIYMMLLNGMK